MFRTEIKIEQALFKINHENKILSLGSCFANTMAKKLIENKFNVLANPYGIIYNPISLFNLLTLPSLLFDKNSFLQNENVWLNYHFHSDFFEYSKDELLNKIQETHKATIEFIKNAHTIIFTFGTAYVYKQVASNSIVANCHKSPAKEFTKELLSSSEIAEQFAQLNTTITSFNPDIKYVFTVSPVRHIKDTIPLNALSKSILRVACNEIAEKHSNAIYFPSFEIMMDDLRDYRFYKKDMIHPTEVAENYIWDKFTSAFFSNDTQKIISSWQSILKALEHKPFHSGSEAHQRFLQETLLKVQQLCNYFNVNKEITFLENKLNKL